MQGATSLGARVCSLPGPAHPARRASRLSRSRRSKYKLGTSSMSHVSIRARLIFLSVLLLAILAVSSALLIRELMHHSQSLAEQARLVSIVRTATTPSKHFGDLKYWLTDLAITQLARSQENAAAAKAHLDEDLKAIAAVHSEGVAAIGREVDSLIEREHLERERRLADAEIRRARDAAEAALRELKAAQANLIQAEKMASLGQLTAGIAHEIK